MDSTKTNFMGKCVFEHHFYCEWEYWEQVILRGRKRFSNADYRKNPIIQLYNNTNAVLNDFTDLWEGDIS